MSRHFVRGDALVFRYPRRRDVPEELSLSELVRSVCLGQGALRWVVVAELDHEAYELDLKRLPRVGRRDEYSVWHVPARAFAWLSQWEWVA